MLAMMFCIMSVLNGAFVFAATSETKKNEQSPKPQNEIIGQITSINASSVTIKVATRNEMQKPPEKKSNETPPEKPANDGENKPNMDNMWTLTGETKTINISSAKFDDHMAPPKENGNNSSNETNETQKTKTYADYKVGDYIKIELTNSSSLVAVSVRDANAGGPGGAIGNPREDGDRKEPPKQNK